MIAAANGHLKGVLLLSDSSSINAVYPDGQHVLWYSLENLYIFEKLLELGCDPNLQDKDGVSLLHKVDELGLELFAIALLQAGASRNNTNNNGDTPIDIARKAAAAEEEESLRPSPGLQRSRHGYNRTMELSHQVVRVCKD